MANTNSTTVTNFEATPMVVADASTSYASTRVYVETFEVLAADNDGQTYTCFPVSLDARVDDLLVTCDAITGGSDYDFGFYKITDGALGAAIDADIITDGANLSSALTAWNSLYGEGTSSVDIPDVKKKLWDLLGYADLDAARTANPTNQVYFVVTANTVGTVTASLGVKLIVSVE